MAQANDIQRRCCLRSITKTIDEIDNLLNNQEISEEVDAHLESALLMLEFRWRKYEATLATSFAAHTKMSFEAVYASGFDSYEGHWSTMYAAKS